MRERLVWRIGRLYKIIIIIILWLAARPPGEYRGCGKVAEGHLDFALQRVAHGLPLGREDRVRPERRCLRSIGGVPEQGEWRRHSIGQNPMEQGIGIRRALDEHGIRLILRQRCHQ